MNCLEPILAHVMKELSHNPPTDLELNTLDCLYDGLTRRDDALMGTRRYSTKY